MTSHISGMIFDTNAQKQKCGAHQTTLSRAAADKSECVCTRGAKACSDDSLHNPSKIM